MAEARLTTPSRRYTRLNLQAVTTFGTLVPTTTKPSAGVVYDLTGSVNDLVVPDPSLVTILPWSSVSSATSLAVRVWGWTAYTQTSGTLVWFPRLLLDATLAYPTSNSGISVDGANIFHMGTITATASITPTPVTFSPGVGVGAAAQATFDPLGSQMVTVQMTSNTINQTCGVFWATV